MRVRVLGQQQEVSVAPQGRRTTAEIFQCEFAFARIKQTTATMTYRVIILPGGFGAYNFVVGITVRAPQRGRLL